MPSDRSSLDGLPPYRVLRTGGTAAASAPAASLEIFPNPAFPGFSPETRYSSFAAAAGLSQQHPADDKVIPSLVVNNPENAHVCPRSALIGGFLYDTSLTSNALDRVGGHCLRCSSVCSADTAARSDFPFKP